ncbi:sorbitol/mannitol transport system substrate-binding protein [Luteibacter rhizovicinus]|uniref:Sorbitol/mannitol transport system substrate-binding protein n=1 Tax=Luteibacter rhizovicinus TaxID=242606 RepID=A0A4R3YLR4_9GAMM|nr:sugar ABC transporter substrate-binding protein [Luteibacter rhizovicinus]TCV92408.1 sorbitol/mannitol transport system substrate-binding protein [Luteibacter rhizovicinus]
MNDLRNRLSSFVLAASIATASGIAAPALADTTLTIGTVNNADMVRMQALSSEYEKSHAGVHLNWVVLEENTLRQRLTTDIATHGGQFDVVTIGAYEAPLWGAQHWLQPLDNLPASYDVNDIFANVREQLTVDKHLYAVPFYAEASITYYRSDLFAQHGLTMPPSPTWDQMRDFAAKLHDPEHGMYGICLRGKAGWGENMALLGTIVNSYGGRWFDEQWRPQIDTPPWHQAVNFYVGLLSKYGPPGPSDNGFNENLALFAAGRCAMWVDASVGGGTVSDPKESRVAGKVGYARAPHQVTDRGSAWLWVWSLAIPASSKQTDAARDFILWATSREYLELVAARYGEAATPPGTRESTYASQAYLKAAPFAQVTYDSLRAVDPAHPTLLPVPYKGIQIVSIPEFQAVASLVGRLVAGALAGRGNVDDVLHTSQNAVNRTMKRAGYYDAPVVPKKEAQP